MTMADGLSDESGPTEERTPIRIADHPRAHASIVRASAWGAIVGFGITAWFGYKVGNPFVDIVIRSMLIGAASSLGVRFVAGQVWKQIIFAEVAAARKEALETQKAILDELEDPSKIDGAGNRPD